MPATNSLIKNKHNLFTLEGVNPGDRIAVAMSGGVDSSVAAALMVEAGYDVVGITLQLYDHGEMTQKTKACCAGQDIYDARCVADKMNFPHYVLDYESVFKQNVIEDFADSYLKGETPIPCVRCNQQVKFKDLLETSKDLGAKAMVTGHYVRRIQGQNRSELHRAADYSRDQSYFLFTTTQEQLDYLRFPLGNIPKTETRKLAEKFDLKIAEKPDSQDICFVPNGNYASVVSKLRPGALDPGAIVHIDNGRILGKHNGIINYTIGQRKGLGIAYPEPLYVIKIDALNKQVWVGPKEALATVTIYLQEVNWLEEKEKFINGISCTVKIRSTHEPIPAIVTSTPNGAKADFKKAEYGVSAGQACVFYDGDRVIGGGWITASPEISH